MNVCRKVGRQVGRHVGRNDHEILALGWGRYDGDVGCAVCMHLVFRRVLGTVAMKLGLGNAVSLYTVRSQATERLPRVPF